MRRVMTVVLLAASCLAGGCALENGDIEPGLPFGTVAGDVPVLLAAGIINTGVTTRDVAMTPDGRHLYYCMAGPGYRQAVILETHFADGRWTDPAVAPFSGSPDWIDLEPFISPDGERFFFMSTRPNSGEDQGEADIWVMDRQESSQEDRHLVTWGAPYNLGAPVNSEEEEYFPAVTSNGTLYFTRADETGRNYAIFRARPVVGGYGEPERLPEQVNCGTNRFNATITPDESRLIVSALGIPGSRAAVDYFLVRRNADDSWQEPVSLGPVINDGSGQSWSPYLTPDGKWFMFMSTRRAHAQPAWPPTWGQLQADHLVAGGGHPNIYVVRADFLDSLGGQKAAGHPDPEPAPEAGSAPEPRPWPELSGPYLGQTPPGREPVVFAPGLVSTGLNERDLLVSPDGQTIWYGFMGQGLVTIMETRLEGGTWTEPAPVAFHAEGEFVCFEPTLSADGRQVFFLSNRAAPGQEQGQGWANQNIFTSRRQLDGSWTRAVPLPGPVTTAGAEYFPSLADDGTLYFTREDDEGAAAIWSAEPAGSGYGEVRRLPPAVNSGKNNFNATVAPDESWIILCVAGREGNLGDADYWISFRDARGKWGPARNMGPLFNGERWRASSVSLSPDGRYLFFSSNRLQMPESAPITRASMLEEHAGPGHGSLDIWWVEAAVIQDFR